MKSIGVKITMVTLIITIALALIYTVFNTSYAYFAVIIASLSSVLIMKVLGKSKKAVITKNGVFVAVGVGIIVYFLIFNVLDQSVVNSIKNL